MKITAAPTEQITRVDGQPCRVWHAVTENGVKFLMFVSRVAVAPEEDATEFERDLAQMPAPREVSIAQVYDPRMII